MRRRASPAASQSLPTSVLDSLQRGLEALRCFRAGEDVLGTAELARRLGLPRKTTLRLLLTLEAHGFVRHVPDTEQFGLDVACLFVGQALLSSSALVRKARPVLQSLAERFDVHVLLCVPERLDMLALFHAAGKSAQPLPLGAGLALPVASTALGCAWLWTQRPAVQGEWLVRLRDEAPAQGGSTPAATIYQSFRDIEMGGVCFSVDGWRNGLAMVAAPVVLHDGSTASIGCLRADATPGSVVFDPACGPALREAAEQIRAAVQRMDR